MDPPPPSYGDSNAKTPAGYPVDEKRPPGPKAPPVPPQPAQAGPSYAAQYACVILSSSDRMRLLNFPESINANVQGILQHAWPPGIQSQSRLEYGPGVEYKLRGRPWYGQGSEAVPSRRLLIHLLHGLALLGWHLAAATDLSKKAYDKDTLFFRLGPPIPRVFFSVSFNESDKIRLIDPPNEQVKQAFIHTVRTWPLGVQQEKEKEYGCYQMKLRGNAWYTSNGQQVSQAHLLVMNLLTVMDNMGYELAACVDMSTGTGEDFNDIDSWFFAGKIA